MDQLRRLPRAVHLSALLALAALAGIGAERSPGMGAALETDMLASLASVAVGLVVAGLVLSRIGARR
jgi:hypothetical protein